MATTQNTESPTNLEIREALYKFAKSDMRTARKEGEIFITDTKRGLVALSYDRDAKTYRVDTQGMDSECLIKNAKAGEAVYAIADLYCVEG